MRRRTWTRGINGHACAALLALMGCSGSHGALMDGGDDGAIADAGVDAIVDASADAVVDAHPDTGSDAGSRLPPPYDDVARRLAEAVCDVIEPCDSGLRALTGGACVEWHRIYFEDEDIAFWLRSVTEGRAVFDPDAFEGCLAAVRDAGCSSGDLADLPECRRALRGLGVDGDSCWLPFDCRPDLGCVFDLSCPGHCTARPGDGEPCPDGHLCAPGLDCARDLVCRPQAVAGEDCGGSAGVWCRSGLACIGLTNDTSVPGTCVAVDDSRSAALGDACDLVVGPYCAGDGVCALQTWDAVDEVGTWLCEAPYALDGPCREAAPSGCPVESYCDTSVETGRLVGSCTRFPQLGDHCESSSDWFAPADCAVGLMCTIDGCVPMGRPGDACESFDDCPFSNCVDGVCQIGACY